ncbi:MAG: hypothetical protein KAJ66_04895 [Candidatus Omnitrophica bacterium]|nr:hypothetical protein [Candidatus Omnitrophota bacterium]
MLTVAYLKKNSAFALILTVGVLALVALIAFSFAVNMRLDQNAASTYTDSFKARCLAEGGINIAIAELKSNNIYYGAKGTFVYDGDYNGDGDTTGDEDGAFNDDSLYGNCGEYSVIVEDEQRRININNTENPNVGQILKNLTMMIGFPLSYAECDTIAANAPYETKEEIMTIPGIGETKYNAIKDRITLHAYKDPNCDDKSPINVNTADGLVLMAALFGISDGTHSINTDVIALVHDHIIFNRPYYSWDDFNNCIDNSSLTTDGKKELVKNNCNPNRDKAGLTTSTTEFCFFSGGKYTLTATGTIYAAADQTTITAQKTTRAIVDIYDTLNQTKKSDFHGSAAGDLLPITHKVTTLDRCPVRGDEQTLYDNGPYSATNTSGYETIKDSIKIGFWDDFEVDSNETSHGNVLFYMAGIGSWVNRGTGFADNNVWNGENGTSTSDNEYIISDADTIKGYDSDGSNELELEFINMDTKEDNWPGYRCTLGTSSDGNLNWHDFSYSLQIFDMEAVVPRISPPYPVWNNAAWNQGHAAYRIVGTNQNDGLCCGFNCYVDHWPPPDTVYYLGRERWIPSKAGGTNMAPDLWATEKRAKFVASGTDMRYYVSVGGNNLQQSFLNESIGSPCDTQGLVGMWAWKINTRYDNIRIIPRSPDDEDENGNYDDYAYFVSNVLPQTNFSEAVRGGAAWGTVTIPSSANKNTEKVSFQISTDGGSSWIPSAVPGVQPGGGIDWAAAQGAQIQYKANFEINDASNNYPGDQLYRETPVLEDVFITYLPETKILYWSNL